MQMQLIKSSGATLTQALQICNSKNRVSAKYQYVVIADKSGNHFFRVDTLTSKKLRDARNHKTLVMESVCAVADPKSNDTPFWSGHCVTCDRPYCPYNFYKWGSGPR